MPLRGMSRGLYPRLQSGCANEARLWVRALYRRLKKHRGYQPGSSSGSSYQSPLSSHTGGSCHSPSG